MSRYRELVASVELIYQQASVAFSAFHSQSGLHCPTGCGACCLNPNVSACIAEMLPVAFYLVDTGKVEETLEMLNDSDRKYCLFYQADSEDGRLGHCTQYQRRAMICRSFGVAAVQNKFGEKVLSICRVLKGHHLQLMLQLKADGAPLMSEYARLVYVIEPALAIEMPINQALKQALLIADQDNYYQTIAQSN